MRGNSIRTACGTLLSLVVVAGAAGCSNGDGSASDAASKAASAAASIGSQAADAVDSATDSAKKKLDEVKDGVDAKDAVKLGDVTTDAEGSSTVTVTARNTDDSTKSFAVKVDFKDPAGNLVDTVVVTVSDVAAGESKDATARSTHKLSGDVTATPGTALRY
ncbi:FxLYD domain-containing protein [Streptomyces sp. NBC_01351]|uniref:FxLYD domain-containing protein n=1 Tax=Streptomyces sp. NBC_01351 TaxID=2903833 RepID=UPI002E33A366|nr:FxLYD domain-containing protein [Streptomyces sp. NBC_01351]